MKFSVKRLILTTCLLAASLKVSPMGVPADAGLTNVDVSKFFGGAHSASELQTRVDANFDKTGWFSLFCTAGPVDAKLREVAASQAETQAAIDALKANTAISEAAKSAAIGELERRQEFLSQVGKCHEGLRDDLRQAKQTIAVNAGEIDRIAAIDKGGVVVARDTKIAKTVNQAMIAPFERATTCFNHVVTGDPLARPQATLGKEFVDGKADPYVESNRQVEQVASELDSKAARAGAELAQRELTEKCKVSGDSSWDCWDNRVKMKAAAATEWIAGGWKVLGQNVAPKLEAAKAITLADVRSYKAITLADVRSYGADKWKAVRDYGICNHKLECTVANPECTVDIDGHAFCADPHSSSPYDNPMQYYAIQGGKIVGGIALAAVGLYAAYKLAKLGWRGACALKNALWTNRSKTARAAIILALGTAVAVAPSTAMAYGYMQ